MRYYYFLQLIFLFFFIFQIQVKSQNIYACAYDQGLYVVNPDSCSATLLCDCGLLTDIAYEGGVLYGTCSGSIYTIDTVTGLQTMISQSANVFNALVGDGNGHLFAAGDSKIYEYDITAGTYTLIGDVGYSSEGDMAFKDSKLYMIGVGQVLIKINLSPFSYSILGTLNFGGYPSYGLVAVTSHDTTTLYASVLYGCDDNKLYQVNEQNVSTTLICSDILNKIDGGITGLTNTTKKTEGINTINWNNNISVYPNPMTNSTTIRCKNKKNDKYILILRDIQGKELLLQNIEFVNTYKLDLTNIDNGIYFLTLQNDEIQMTQKIIVQK